MQQSSKSPLSLSANSSPHPARWPLSTNQAKDHRTFYHVTLTAIGATCATKTATKTNSAWNKGSVS